MDEQSIRPVQIGLVRPMFSGAIDGRTPTWPVLRTMARLAEDVGFDAVWVFGELLWRFDDGAFRWLPGVLVDPFGRGRCDDPGLGRDARRRCELLQPGAPGQDGRHGRRDQWREARPRTRQRMVGRRERERPLLPRRTRETESTDCGGRCPSTNRGALLREGRNPLEAGGEKTIFAPIP